MDVIVVCVMYRGSLCSDMLTVTFSEAVQLSVAVYPKGPL